MPSTRAIVPSISGCDPAETSLRCASLWGAPGVRHAILRFQRDLARRGVRHSILRFSIFRPVSAESVCWTFGFPFSFGDFTVRIHQVRIITQKFRVNTAKIFGEVDPQRFTVGQNLSVVLSRRFIVGQNLSVVLSRRFIVGQNLSVVLSRGFIDVAAQHFLEVRLRTTRQEVNKTLVAGIVLDTNIWIASQPQTLPSSLHGLEASLGLPTSYLSSI